MTIGNILKDIRRKPSRMAQILLGYIPTTKLTWLTSKAARRRALTNLFHACMRDVLQSISKPGENGVAMMSGDGVWRRCHPIFANFVGDYPKQALVTCTYNGRCFKCGVTPDQLGEYQTFPPHLQSLAIETYLLADKEACVFHVACRKTGLKPVYHPFWESLLLADIFLPITPDVLHQLLQGMMKHLIGWLVRIFGPTEINARCRAIPPNCNIMLFTKGITLSCVSGHEHKKMCSIFTWTGRRSPNSGWVGFNPPYACCACTLGLPLSGPTPVSYKRDPRSIANGSFGVSQTQGHIHRPWNTERF